VGKGQTRLGRPTQCSRQASQHNRAYAEITATVLKIEAGIRSPCVTLALPCLDAKVVEWRVRDKLRDVLVLNTNIVGITQPTVVQFVPQFQ
jgi:hypothetical protein